MKWRYFHTFSYCTAKNVTAENALVSDQKLGYSTIVSVLFVLQHGYTCSRAFWILGLPGNQGGDWAADQASWDLWISGHLAAEGVVGLKLQYISKRIKTWPCSFSVAVKSTHFGVNESEQVQSNFTVVGQKLVMCHHLLWQGVLLYGPPGTGKTLLARAVAHHTNCCLLPQFHGVLAKKHTTESGWWFWTCLFSITWDDQPPANQESKYFLPPKAVGEDLNKFPGFIRVSGGELVQKYIGEGREREREVNHLQVLVLNI